MIVRNEERFLDACLQSARRLVDEIVIVDTGSTDRSLEIARDHGARVFELPWQGDFATARNRALAEARGRFFLYIDADEQVVEGTRDELEIVLADPSVIAGTVRFRPGAGFTPYLEYRLLRRDPRLSFRGVIHESFMDGLLEWNAAGGRIVSTSVALDHYGYDGDISHKHPRNLPLLLERLAATPGHLYSWCHLASTYEGMSQEADAESAWRRAVELVSSRPAFLGADVLPFIGLLALLRRQGRPVEERRALVEQALARFPFNATVRWYHGRELLEGGDYAAAEQVFRELLRVDAGTFCDPSVAHRGEIFGLWSIDSLALCAFRQGRFAEAARLWAEAEGLAPQGEAYRARRLLAEAKARG